jgi:hypothetical protein
VDRHNSAVLHSWLDAGQSPTDAAVGADGMSAVWLLAQHADADPVLQAKLLEHYGAVPDFGGIEGRRYAMLVDRVLRARKAAALWFAVPPRLTPIVRLKCRRWRIRNALMNCVQKSD